MMQYTVYKTVNLTNGKFYIGVHKTDNPNDDYLGSGKIIKRAVSKYGEQNFRKEVLFVFATQQEAWDKENEIVEENRKNPLSYNLRRGGSGGFDYINQKGLHSTEVGLAKMNGNPKFHAKATASRKMRPNWAAKITEIITKHRGSFKGREHTDETKRLMSEKAKARVTPNPSQGTRWIYSSDGVKKIKQEELSACLDDGWKLGRKFVAGK